MTGHCRQLPAQLCAATRLTLLVLNTVGTEGTQLSIPADALPCSLQRLRLTQYLDNSISDICNGGTMPKLLRNMASLDSLQRLHLTVDSCGKHCLPTG